MASKAGAATAAPTEAPKRRGRPPGTKNKTNGAKPGPKATKAAKVFEIFGIGEGKNLTHLTTVKGVNTGGAAVLKAVKDGAIEADTPVVPVSSRFLTPVKIEAEQREPTYKVTTIGSARAKKDPNAPKRKYTRRAKTDDTANAAAAVTQATEPVVSPAPVAAAAPAAGSPAEAGNPFAT